jgi:flagellar basal-body rod protein FlgB
MDFSTIPLFSVMKAKLGYLSERQSVLAQNVANADTPGYKAMDIPLPDFSKMAGGASQGLKMTVTNPGHIMHGPGQASAFKPEKRPSTYELSLNGNNVVIEEEMSKVGANQAEYQKVLNLYGKAVTMFKTAIGNANTGS